MNINIFSKLLNRNATKTKSEDSPNKGFAGNKIPFGYIMDDYNPEWHDKNKFPKIQKISNDPMVSACIDAIKLPIEHTSIMIEQASEDNRNLQIAEAVENEIKNNPLWDWSNIQRHALEMIPWGNGTFAVKPFRMQNDSINHINMMPRLPETLERWFYDNTGQLVSIEQHVTLPDGIDKYYKINAEDLVIFTNNMRGINLEGESMLRAIWLQWYNKDFVIKQAMRAVQIGAVPAPAITLSPTPGPNDAVNAEKAAANWVGSNKNYIVLPDGSKIDFVGDMGAIDKLVAFIQQANTEIATRFLAKFMVLGVGSSTGSYAMSTNDTDFFKLALKSKQRIIETTMNKKFIRPFVDMNFGKQYECPKLKYGKLNAVSADELSIILERLARNNFLSPTEEIRDQLLEELDLPSEQTFLPVSQNLPVTIDNNTKEEPEQEPDEMCSCGHSHEFKDDSTDIKFRRKLTETEEKLADIPEYLDKLNAFKREFERIGMERKTAMIKKLTAKGKSILNKKLSLGDFVAELDEYIKDADNKLGVKTFVSKLNVPGNKTLKYGKQTVRDELKKQKDGVEFAEPPDSLEDEEKETVSILNYVAAAALVAQLTSVWRDEMIRQRTSGINSGTILDNVLKETSKVPFANKIGSLANQLWGNGRGRETVGLQESGQIEYLIRSEIMDKNICTNCIPIDGKEIYPEDPLWNDVINGPYSQCLGGTKCRGFNMIVIK